jgi:hypothetical protein
VAPPEHFAVDDGAPAPGEEERATAWGRGLLILPGA